MSAFPWYNSIRFRISLALFALFALQAGTAGFTLYEVDLRKHDYEILNLAGQMRVISHAVVHQSRNYLDSGADQNSRDYRRDLNLYYRDLQQNISLFDKIITSFRNRRLAPELTGHAEPLVCNWDKDSRNQLDVSALQWDNFNSGLRVSFGTNPDKPDLLNAARYITRNGAELVGSSDDLTHAFQHMMEGKLATIRLFNQIAFFVSALLTLLIVVQIYRKILRPLNITTEAFGRVANGELGYQVPVLVGNEIGHMSQSFNRLSDRLRGVFRLTDRISRGTNLDDALKFICEEFHAFLPVEWVGVLLLTPDRSHTALERMYSEIRSSLKENERFNFALGLPEDALGNGRAFAADDLASLAVGLPPDSFVYRLQQDGKQSALFVPLAYNQSGKALLVFASSQQKAYTPEHVEFLSNLASQISHILEKTLALEELVVAAVEGLAKLAESRDPETGDHLIRMSLYSAIIAEEMGRTEKHGERITASYVRDIFRFAPMHDIGKVGIRDDILLKPGKLTPEERTEMERHPTIGGLVLRRSEEQVNNLGHNIFQVGIEIAEAHHEKYDGSGYPNKLQGEDIPLSARIIAVADVFDALTSKRPYKEAWTIDQALENISTSAGKHFDPEVVNAMHRAMPRILEIYKELKHV